MSESWKEFSVMVSEAYDRFWEKNRLAVIKMGGSFGRGFRGSAQEPTMN